MAYVPYGYTTALGNLSSPAGSTQLSASPTHATQHSELTKLATEVYNGALRRETYNEIYAADYGVAAANTASANGTALRNLLANEGAGKTVILPTGTILVNTVAHPSHNDYCAIWLKSNTTLVIPTGTVVKLGGGVNSVQSGVHRIITNYNMSSSSVDTNIRVVGGGMIDGSANDNIFAGSTDSTTKGTGVTFWYATKCMADDIHTLDVSGWNAGNGEGFTFYAHKSSKVAFRNCTAEATSATYAANKAAATGFGDTSCSDVTYYACRVKNSQGQGFTTFGSNNIGYIYCTTEKIDNTHFNHEYSRNVVYKGCWAGGRYPSEIALNLLQQLTTAGVSGTTGSFDYNAVRTQAGVDEVGFKLAYNHGGGDVTIDSCYAGGFTNGAGGCAAVAIEPNDTNATVASVTGTGPYTITAAGNVFHGQMIGNYVQLGTNAPVIITGVTSQTVCTTEVNPGTASGQTVYVWSGRTNIRNMTIADSTYGFIIQNSNNTTGNNRRACAVTRIDDMKIRNCGTDMAGVAVNGSNVGQTLNTAAGGVVTQYAGSNLGQWTSGSAWMNTYPFDVDVYMTPTSPFSITLLALGGASGTLPTNTTTVRLRPGDSVTHTFSTMPTVVARF